MKNLIKKKNKNIVRFKNKSMRVVYYMKTLKTILEMGIWFIKQKYIGGKFVTLIYNKQQLFRDK